MQLKRISGNPQDIGLFFEKNDTFVEEVTLIVWSSGLLPPPWQPGHCKSN